MTKAGMASLERSGFDRLPMEPPADRRHDLAGWRGIEQGVEISSPIPI